MMNYFITAIYEVKGMFYWQRARRTFGFFHNLKDALKAVEENQCDMSECFYNYIVIEGINEGIHPSVKEDYWFEWRDGHWERLCGKPELLVGTTNFSLG